MIAPMHVLSSERLIVRLPVALFVWAIAGCAKDSAPPEQDVPATELVGQQAAAPRPQAAGKSAGAPSGVGGAAPTAIKLAQSHARMEARLAHVVAGTHFNNSVHGLGYLESLRTKLSDPHSARAGRPRAMSMVMLADHELRAGKHDTAISLLEQALALLEPDAEVPSNRGPRTHALFQLGVAYLRAGEIENCCARETPDSCIVPIRGGGLHTDPRGSEGAIAHLTEVLRRTDSTEALHWQALWLLNVANMTLNRWPSGVEASHRLPESTFRAEAEFPEFASVGARAGLNRSSLGGGAVVDDLNGDGHLDVVVSAQHPAAPLAVHYNLGSGRFENRAERAGLSGITGGTNLVQADYDNDGKLDFFVCRGAGLGGQGRVPNSLVRNQGDGTFLDVTFAAGLAEPAFPTAAAAWADVDLDGDLDLFVANEAEVPSVGHPSQLFQNDGKGRFVDIAASAGVLNLRWAKGAVFGDFNGDRYPDLYVSNHNAENRLYRNNGDGTFTDIAAQVGVLGPRASSVVWWWDANNDGLLDLFVAANAANTATLAAHAMGAPGFAAEWPALYENVAGEGFANVTEKHGLQRHMAALAGNFGDIDGDGKLDIYIGTGHAFFGELMPNRLFVQRSGADGWRFVDVTMAARMGHLQKGHAVAFADVDRDGDLDVFQQMGGVFPADTFVDVLYENPGFSAGWVTLLLEGATSNRSAIGARIGVTVSHPTGPTTIWRWVSSGGSHGASPLRQTIGLGNASSIVAVSVDWPSAGPQQRYTGVSLNGAYVLREHAGAAEPLP
jgi:hypothetical protein